MMRARVHGVDVQDVGDVQDRVGIVLDPIGLDGEPLVVDLQHARTGVGQVHPHRCGTGAAVEGEHQGTRLALGQTRALVEGVEQGRDRLAVGVPRGLGSGGHLVGDLGPADGHRVALGRGVVRGGGNHSVVVLGRTWLFHLAGKQRRGEG